MDWANKFYSQTGKWWGPAESKIGQRDYLRAKIIKRLAPSCKTVLELGSGYGNTAAACAESGFNVTALELSDRIEFAKQYESKNYSGSVKFIKGSFYDVKITGKFDVIAYWNGLGVGTDFDQRKLLKRISGEWLNTDGIVLIDVQNPFAWAKWAGEIENKKARPEAGYNFNISEKFDFDPVNNRLIDTWWETEKPDEKISQNLRCYSPVDFRLLLEGTGLRLTHIEIKEQKIDLEKSYDKTSLFMDNSEYLAILSHFAPS